MKKNLHKFESTMWLVIKLSLYCAVMVIFFGLMGRDSIGLTRLSRTLGITASTFCIVGLLFLSVYGKYDVGRRKSKPIIYSLSLAIVCTDVITYLQLMIMKTNSNSALDFRLHSIGPLILSIALQILVIVIYTYFGNWLFFKIHEPERCLVVTNSQKSLDEIVFAIRKFKKQYQIVEVLDYHTPDIKQHIKEVDTVFIHNVPAENRTKMMRYCYHYNKNVYFNPEIEDIMEMNAEQYVLDDVCLFNKNVKGLTMEQRIAKRLLDITLSLILGILSSPFWLIAMLAIKLEDGGPVLFTQERATLHGRRFKVYKLRTMKPNNDNHSVTENDSRITKVGAFLRRTRIDELPQLLNVLKGDMSFVGPRPEMMKNVEDYTDELPEFEYRLRMKGGLTGYAQVIGKYNTTPKDKLIMDMMYIEKFSVWKDIQLIFQTAIVLFKHDSTEAFKEEVGKSKYKFVKWEEDSLNRQTDEGQKARKN